MVIPTDKDESYDLILYRNIVSIKYKRYHECIFHNWTRIGCREEELLEYMKEDGDIEVNSYEAIMIELKYGQGMLISPYGYNFSQDDMITMSWVNKSYSLAIDGIYKDLSKRISLS